VSHVKSFDLKTIIKYPQANKFVKAAMTAIAVQASAEDVKLPREVFVTLD
jgi:hypothetical protein